MINRKTTLFVAYISIFLPLRPQTIYLFSHGLADTSKQAFAYAKTYKNNGEIHHNNHYFFYRPFFSFNYPDATEGFHRVNRYETSMAQDNEIARLKAAYEKTIESMHDRGITHYEMVLFGISRGASSIINFVGLHNPQHIKALVLESPFDSVATIIDSMMQTFNMDWLPHSYGEYLMERIFRRYKRDGIRPINLVDRINGDMPILIICSKQDQLVPWHSSVRLYQKLCKSGHKHVYIYIANHGKHAKIIRDKDSKTYQDVVHAFYRTYGLPHDLQLAENGQKLLDLCQPTL